MQFESRAPAQETQLFLKKPVLRSFIIGFLFTTAFGIRLYHINEPPLDFHPTRQYRSALIARGYYFETMESIPEWKKRVASINKQREGFIEPPIMELIASFAYRIVDGEHLWIPRLLSSILWLVGGGFLYLIAKKTVSTDAAVFSTAFYLFLPFGISASRSFQPDPMMVMMFLFSIFTILRYYDQPSRRRLATAATVSALAISIKPGICLFPVLGAFVSLAICKKGIRKSVISSHLLIFVVVSLLPGIIYCFYGMFITGVLPGQIQGIFFPHLLLYPFFWKGWLTMIARVVGYIALIGALTGVLMLRERLPRALLIGLWSGYFVFGLVFTYHIHTHDYYQLQFIPIVALSLGPISALVINRLTKKVYKRWHVSVLGILLLAVFLSIGLGMCQVQWRHIKPDVKSKLKTLGAIFGINPQSIGFIIPSFEFESEVRIAQKIGECVCHSTRCVFLTSAYGKPLEYHGELSGFSWPRRWDFRLNALRGLRELGAEERFNALDSEYSPEYFIVTDFREFEEQVDLRRFLFSKFPILVQNDDYLIFDLRKYRDFSSRSQMTPLKSDAL